MQKFKVLSSKKQRKADRSVRLLFPLALYERMCSAFAESEGAARESYAIAQYGYKVDPTRKSWTYMVRSLHVPAKEDLFEQSSITVTPKAEFMEAVLSDAAQKNNAVLEIHTHVGSKEPNFSWVDIENGLENGRFLKACGLRFAMAVIGSEGFSFCEYDADHDALQIPESVHISVASRIGVKDMAVHRCHSSCEIPLKPGPESMSVSVAGLDGVGFGIVHMLARMGVKKFTLIDEGTVDDNGPEVTAYAPDKGKKLTRAAHSMLKKISRDIEVEHINDVNNAIPALKGSDVIFCCSDDGRIKALTNSTSLKYFIPCIEARTLVKKDLQGLYGRVRVFMPSATGCMGCFTDEPLEAPGCTDSSRVAVNNVVASMAVQEFIDIISLNVPVLKAYDHIEYDPATQAMDRKAGGKNDECPLCGMNGVLGAGDDRRPAGKAVKAKKTIST